MEAVAKHVQEPFDPVPLEKILKKFARKKGAIIPLLQEAQKAYGYLPKAALIRMAEATNTDISQIYGVATFYSQFRLKPVGRNIIKVCHGTACHVSGAERITEACEEALGVHDGETTPDREFTLESVACLGCCSLAPVMMIGETTYGRLTDRETKKIIKKMKK
ncbi:NADH-quinone oxidoreductase subunit E [candidate division KSB1 bacterium 4484_188]|nr:MAG: NADH-quinone oxidoreductase subunit E [candidate division KSB1 bacterium 4484_188]